MYIKFIDYWNWFAQGVTTSWFGNLLWVVTGFAFSLIVISMQRFYNNFRTRYFVRFISVQSSSMISLIVGTNTHVSHSNCEYQGLSVPVTAAVNCLLNGITQRKSLRNSVKLIFDSGSQLQFPKENIIAIGGPSTNNIVRHFVLAGDVSLHSPTKTDILNERKFVGITGDEYQVIHGHNTIRDYGLIVRLPHPIDTTKRMILVYGIETFGTAGAIIGLLGLDRILKAAKLSRPRYNEIINLPHFELLIEVSVVQNTLSQRIRICEMWVGKDNNSVEWSTNKTFEVELGTLWGNKQ